MNIIVKKLSDVDLLREANAFTTGHESNMGLRTAYRLMHTPVRTQMFVVKLIDIPLFAASQIIRAHVGVEKWMLIKRTDRGGEDFREACSDVSRKIRERLQNICERIRSDVIVSYGDIADDMKEMMKAVDEIDTFPARFDRYAPTSVMMLLNAEAIVNISYKRLCATASSETREIWQHVLSLIEEHDPNLVKQCVKPCVATGICREKPGCGFIRTELFRKLRDNYKTLFT
jgi:hypothetical protein